MHEIDNVMVNLMCAGLTGMLLASAALREGMAAPVMHLRNINPHVAAALKDWGRHSGHVAAVPRQLSGVYSVHPFKL